MKRILWLGTFTLSFLLLQPVYSHAWGWRYGVPPECAHGFGWLKAKALNHSPWIHQHGPLFNYGPYYPWGPGYNQLEIPRHHLGHYVPAYPAAYYMYGNGAHAAPAAKPVTAAPAVPQMIPPAAHSPSPLVQTNLVDELTPVSYETLYPIYLQPLWPTRD